MQRSFLIAIAAAGALLSSCGKAPETATADVKPSKRELLEGLYAPGTAEDAKSLGFKNCTPDYYQITCKFNEQRPFFGVIPREISVGLDGKNNLAIGNIMPPPSEFDNKDARTVPFDRLSYSSVNFEFNEAEYDSKCVDKHHKETGSWEQPTKCILNLNTDRQLMSKLEEYGWVKTWEKGGNISYTSTNQPYTISFHGKTATAVLRAISPEEQALELDSEREKKAAKEAAQKGAELILQKMQ